MPAPSRTGAANLLASSVSAETKHALLIALTGYARPEDREHCMDAGFDDHLVKSVDLQRRKVLIAAGLRND